MAKPRTVQFLAPPSGPLALPADIQRISEQVRKVESLIAAKPGHV